MTLLRPRRRTAANEKEYAQCGRKTNPLFNARRSGAHTQCAMYTSIIWNARNKKNQSPFPITAGLGITEPRAASHPELTSPDISGFYKATKAHKSRC